MRKLLLYILLLGLVGSSACSHHDDSPALSDATASNFGFLQTNVLSSKCVSCHSANNPSGGVDLSSYQQVMKTVVAGSPQASQLYNAVASRTMPPGSPLSADLISAIQAWISSGAKQTGSVTVASASPASVQAGAQVTVSLAGQGFQQNGAVVIGTAHATSVTWVSSTQATALSPVLTPGKYDVTYQNPDGSQGTLSQAFSVTSGTGQTALTIRSVFPSSGSAGTLIAITGTQFSLQTQVTVGGQPCTGIQASPPNQLTCKVGTLSQSGPADVVATNPDHSSYTFQYGFTYTVPASFTTILNTILIPMCVSCHGPNAQQGGIRLDSYDDVMATSIVIPGNPADSSLYTDVQGQIEPRAPANGSKPPPLTPAQIALIYNWILNGAWDDTPPTIVSITPALGSTLGATPVTIVGSRFFPGISVTIGSSACIDPVLDPQGTQIQCTTSAGPAGPADVIAINAPTGGITPLPSTGGSGIYTYVPPPSITQINPSSVPSSNQSAVTVSGTYFRTGLTFQFGVFMGTSVGTPSCDGNHNCTVSVVPPPQAAGAVKVRVTNPDNQFADFTGFSYSAGTPPTLSSVSPTFIYTNTASTLTLAGNGFLPGATVKVGNKTCTGPTVTSSQITCGLNTNTAGSQAVTVTNPDGLSNAAGVSLNVVQLITITTLSPASSNVSGAILTITGNGFVSPTNTSNPATGTQVCIGCTVPSAGAAPTGGTPCGSTQVNSNTTIVCIVPAASGGVAASVAIVAYNPADANGVFKSASRNFSYVPTISGISPNSGPVAGGTSITITGTGFASSSTVTVGGNACTGPVVTGTTSITCTTPAGAATGAASVTVTSNGVSSAASSFLYQ